MQIKQEYTHTNKDGGGKLAGRRSAASDSYSTHNTTLALPESLESLQRLTDEKGEWKLNTLLYQAKTRCEVVATTHRAS